MARLYRPKISYEYPYPIDLYTPEMHLANQDIVGKYIDVLGQESGDGQQIISDWYFSNNGRVLVRAEERDELQRVQLIESVPEGYCHLASHLLKQVIELSPEGLRAKTIPYYKFSQLMGITFANRPVSPGYLRVYHDLRYDPEGASRLLRVHLSDPEDQYQAFREDMVGLYALHARTLRYRAHVKLPYESAQR